MKNVFRLVFIFLFLSFSLSHFHLYIVSSLVLSCSNKNIKCKENTFLAPFFFAFLIMPMQYLWAIPSSLLSHSAFVFFVICYFILQWMLQLVQFFYLVLFVHEMIEFFISMRCRKLRLMVTLIFDKMFYFFLLFFPFKETKALENKVSSHCCLFLIFINFFCDEFLRLTLLCFFENDCRACRKNYFSLNLCFVRYFQLGTRQINQIVTFNLNISRGNVCQMGIIQETCHKRLLSTLSALDAFIVANMNWKWFP